MSDLAPQEGRWIAPPRKPRWGLPFLAGGCFLWQLPNWLSVLGRHGWLSYLVVALVAFTVGVPLAFWIRELLARRKTAADGALADGAFGDQFPVEVTIVVEGRKTGTDRGVAWFDGDLMGFSGAASSFVLAPRDLAPQWMPSKREKQVPGNAVVLRDAPKSAYVTIGPLFGHGRAYRKRFRAFMLGSGTEAERLERFVLGDETHPAERQWPPLVPYVG